MGTHQGHNAYGDDDVDVHGFLNTGASQGMYMPCLDPDEEPLSATHARDDQTGRPSTCVQCRLDFHATGFSQEMPPDADPQDNPAGIIFSPNTLRKAAADQFASLVVDPPCD